MKETLTSPTSDSKPDNTVFWVMLLGMTALVVVAMIQINSGNRAVNNTVKPSGQQATTTSTRSVASVNKTVGSQSDGFRDGYIVGNADARDGRKRRGVWARENGERLGGADYGKGYHHGYNEGWYAWKRAH